jgi:hypothetical protein
MRVWRFRGGADWWRRAFYEGGHLVLKLAAERVPRGLFYSFPNAILFCGLCYGVQVPPGPWLNFCTVLFPADGSMCVLSYGPVWHCRKVQGKGLASRGG